MKSFFFDCGTRDSIASLGILFLRICTGLMMFFGHGLGKIQGFAKIKDGFPVPDFFPLTYLSPSLSLMATIGAEVVCSVLIILGLATRPAAFIFAFTMVVAAFSILGNAPWFIPGGIGPKEGPILYLIPAVAILLTGAGQYSLDASILKERRRKKW